MTVPVNTVSVETDPDDRWSIDELAALAGLPTRTIREYRTLGLLPPPKKVGRVGRYGESHLRRLQLIGRLQARGYSLAGIRDLVEAWGRGATLDDVLEGGLDEGAISLGHDALVGRFPALVDDGLRERAVAVGLVTAADERWIVRAPSLLTLLADAVRHGADPAEALAVTERLRAGAAMGAEALAAVFIDGMRAADVGGELDDFARRARVLIARAAASIFVDEMGRALSARAADLPELAALVDQVRIGATVEADR